MSPGQPVSRGEAGWRYWDAAEPPEGAWASVAFDDDGWDQGEAPLGYGENVIATELDFGGDAEDKHPAAYFRLAFEMPDPAAFPGWRAEIRCDDGAVVYLNGEEVYRYNMAEGDLEGATFSAGKLSSSGNRESRYHAVVLDPDDFQEGANLLAVSVHQSDRGSSDLILDLAVEGLTAEQLEAPERRPLVVDGILEDDDRVSNYIDVWGKHILQRDRSPAPNQWLQQLRRRLSDTAVVDVQSGSREALSPEEIYRRCAASVLILSGVSEAKEREASHAGGFVISSSGLAVTNHHVIASYGQQDLITATTLDGRVVAVREILASDPADDVALIQLDGDGFQPVSLAREAPVGGDVVAISHPREAFYTLTKGHVSRYCQVDDRPRLMITAEFAMGSSGAPVFDRFGSVVGMVEMTSSVAYNVVPLHEEEGSLRLGSKRGSGLFLPMNHQMTFRYIIPCQSIRSFLFPQLEVEE